MNTTKVIIVIIGSVKAADYQNTRLKALKDKKSPRVIRVSTDHFPFDKESEELDLSAVGKRHGISDYEMDPELDDAVYVDPYDLIREEISKQYGITTFDSIEAVVVGGDMSWLYDEYADVDHIAPVFGRSTPVVTVN